MHCHNFDFYFRSEKQKTAKFFGSIFCAIPITISLRSVMLDLTILLSTALLLSAIAGLLVAGNSKGDRATVSRNPWLASRMVALFMLCSTCFAFRRKSMYSARSTSDGTITNQVDSKLLTCTVISRECVVALSEIEKDKRDQCE